MGHFLRAVKCWPFMAMLLDLITKAAKKSKTTWIHNRKINTLQIWIKNVYFQTFIEVEINFVAVPRRFKYITQANLRALVH